MEILWSTIVYRLVNRIETFERIGGIPSIDCWKEYKSLLVNGGKKYWRSYDENVFFTAAHQNMGFRRYHDTLSNLQRKNCAMLKWIMSELQIASSEGDLERCTKTIQSIENVGEFFAWQITCDLMECKAIDGSIIDWVQLGPGAKVSESLL